MPSPSLDQLKNKLLEQFIQICPAPYTRNILIINVSIQICLEQIFNNWNQQFRQSRPVPNTPNILTITFSTQICLGQIYNNWNWCCQGIALLCAATLA